MSSTNVAELQRLNTGSVVVLDGNSYTVEILLDGNTYLRTSSGVVAQVHVQHSDAGEDTGIRVLRSWRNGTPILNKKGHPVQFILLGNLIEEIHVPASH